jgi:hypothetical protein
MEGKMESFLIQSAGKRKRLYIRVQKDQLDAQIILSIFRQTLHVSAVSRPVIRKYNLMYTTICTYYSI